MKHKSHLSNPTLPPRPEASPSVFCHFWDDIVVGWQEQDRWTGEIGLPWRSEVTDIVSNGLMNIWCQIPILAGPDYLAHNTDFLWQQSRGSCWECLERCPDMTLVRRYGCGWRDTQHEQSSNAAQPGSCGEAMVWALRGNEVFGDWLPQMYFSAQAHR